MAMRAVHMAEIHAGVYRQLVTGSGLKRFRVRVEQSDLLISAHGAFAEEASVALHTARRMISGYAAKHDSFYTALRPLPLDENAPCVVRDMLEAGLVACVGPMAAVAGAIAQYVGEALLPLTEEVIVENGGDIYMNTRSPRILCILAESAQTGCLRIRPTLEKRGFGICTSSGKLGPSLSLGNADSVTVLAGRTALADALATRLANRVRCDRDVPGVLDASRKTPAKGVVIMMNHYIGVRGALQILN